MTVIVEPDSLSAWLGLAGVAVGALLAAGAAWLQRRSSDRRDRIREARYAADDLVASANALNVTVKAFLVSKDEPGAVRAWIPVITALLERVQKANATIARLSEPSLVNAADSLAKEARGFALSLGASHGTELDTEISEFSAAALKDRA